jgi:hypothetical protein
MLTIDEVKDYLNMPELPILHTNSERNFYVKKIYDDYYCSNHDQSIIIRAFDDFEPISVSTSRYFSVYVNDFVVLTYVGDHSYNSDIFKIFDGLPFMTLTPEHFYFFITEINTKGKDCIVYFDRLSEKVIDYNGDQNINIVYVCLKEQKYKDKSFYKIVNGEILFAFGLYTNQYFGSDEYKKYFDKIAYLRKYYNLYTFIIYQSINADTVRLLVSTYDFEIVLNNSVTHKHLFEESNHSAAYIYEKNKRTTPITINTIESGDAVGDLIEKIIDGVLKEYPCSYFDLFLSDGGVRYTSLDDKEMDDYVKLFRMSTI